jgi:hypothetical protein
LKLTAGGFCPLPGQGVFAALQVKRRIHLDAAFVVTLSVFFCNFNALRNKIRTAHFQGMSLKPFCNLILHTLGGPSPTDLSTCLVDNSAQAAVILVVP